MNIILAGIDAQLIDAWRIHFADAADVSVIAGDITQIACDAIVSPANSFGFMDGGLDHALSERFGWQLEKQLQQLIQVLPEGELLVGAGVAVAHW